MSTFGGEPSAIIIDPDDLQPVVGAHVTIYPLDPRVEPSEAITDLTDFDDNPYPGYVVTNAAGQVQFKTTTEYHVVYGVDAENYVYRYDAWESRDAALEAGDLFPSMLGAVTDAETAAQAAQEAAEEAADAVSNVQAGLPPFTTVAHPYVSAHRGGAYIHPEGTRVGRINAVGLGMDVIDGGDIHSSSDGVLYDCHDTTLDRTTNLTGPINNMPSMRLVQGKIDASVWFGGGWTDQPITSIVDTLDDLGGKVYITLEIKSEPGALENCQKLVDLLIKRHLDKQVCIVSFDEELLAPAIEANMTVQLLGSTMTTIADRDDLLDLGIDYVCGSASSMTAETADTLMGKGLRVTSYSANRHSRIDKYAEGVSGHLWGYSSDDPFYVKGHIDGDYTYRRTTDPFDSMTYYHGHQPDNMDFEPASRGTFVSGGWFKMPPTNRRAILQGWMSPLETPSNFTVEYDMDFDVAASSAGGAFVFGCANDEPFTGDTQSGGGAGPVAGYSCWFFTSGLLRIWKRGVDTTPVMLGEYSFGAGDEPVIGTPTRLRVDVTPTQITFERVDRPASTITVTDGDYRGGYCHLLTIPEGANAGVRWRNIEVS